MKSGPVRFSRFTATENTATAAAAAHDDGAAGSRPTPQEAWDHLASDPEAILVDVRTRAEWTFVGLPDLTSLGKRVVPIVPDEARTFGMEGLFRQIGIYNPKGQLYTPQDADQLSYYKESESG